MATSIRKMCWIPNYKSTQSKDSYQNWVVGLTMRPELFQAKACARPKENDLSGHCTAGVMCVPHLFCNQLKPVYM